LLSALATVDSHGAAAMLTALRQSEESSLRPVMAPFEPEVVDGKHNYRMYLQDLPVAPVERDFRLPYEPNFMVDVNDDYVHTGILAGHRSDGGARLQYLYATYTARGRLQLATTDFTTTGDTHGYHEVAVDARAHGLSGPFGL
jgi:hypothetical protein